MSADATCAVTTELSEIVEGMLHEISCDQHASWVWPFEHGRSRFRTNSGAVTGLRLGPYSVLGF